MSTPQRIVRLLLALILTCLAPVAAAAQVPQFGALYAFGDSLADNGNIFIQTQRLGYDPAIPPSVSPHRTYFERFSNGFVEVEYLWQQLTGHLPGSPEGMQPFLKSPLIRRPGAMNFAFGGTGTPYVDQTPGGEWAPGLKGQVELFRLALLGRKPPSNALYVIATGANDYRNDPFNVPMKPAAVVRNIEDAIVSLYRLGARHVMLLDLPDLGLIPGNGGDPAATETSIEHNTKLYAMVARLQTRYPSLHLVTVKLNPLFLQLLTTMPYGPVPALAVLGPEGSATCLFFDPASCQDVNPALFNANLGFLFWDVVHPTTEAHKYLADYMYAELVNSYD